MIKRESLSMTFFIHTKHVRLWNNVIITDVLQDDNESRTGFTNTWTRLPEWCWPVGHLDKHEAALNAGKPVWSALPHSRAVWRSLLLLANFPSYELSDVFWFAVMTYKVIEMKQTKDCKCLKNIYISSISNPVFKFYSLPCDIEVSIVKYYNVEI